MKHRYIRKKFTFRSEKLIEHANKIIAEYQGAGYTLTLRQLYYQFVSRGIIENAQREYKNLGFVINNARLAGEIDWNAIEDRTRALREIQTWDDPAAILNAAATTYKTDWWKNQPVYCEVWIEKDALIGVIEPVCNKFRVPYFACRGYTSQSEQHSAGERLAARIRGGQQVVVLHFGDHDPSGIDMTRDNLDRLNLFIGVNNGIIEPSADAIRDIEIAAFRIDRLALNMDQVKKYKPPPNPAKTTDSRFSAYNKKFGTKSWELDALDPKLVGELIEKNIKKLIDNDQWETSERAEQKDVRKLKSIAKKG